jgi:hypothetical protein
MHVFGSRGALMNGDYYTNSIFFFVQTMLVMESSDTYDDFFSERYLHLILLETITV